MDNKKHGTVHQRTQGQFGEIISTLIQTVPDQSFIDAQLLIENKGLWQDEVRKILSSFTIKDVSLQELFDKNSSKKRFTDLEFSMAKIMIQNPIYSKTLGGCRLCQDFFDDINSAAIYDVDICQDHAMKLLHNPK